MLDDTDRDQFRIFNATDWIDIVDFEGQYGLSRLEDRLSEIGLGPNAAVQRLSSDLRTASETLSEAEARYLVQGYYNVQELRIRCDAQVRKLQEGGRPSLLIGWLGGQTRVLESQIKGALDRFGTHHRFGQWPRRVTGIGPVLAAGLIAHTEIERLPTAGHLWSFAGLDPSKSWERGQKRPWNADLKVLAWKIGQSFMKLHNHPADIYGKVYKIQKDKYIERNDDGGFADNAAKALGTKRWRKDTEAFKAYSVGRLPAGHVDAMARRYAVKLFLAHYWAVSYRIHHDSEPPLPYPVVHMGHAHVIPPPTL
jgi:hypothetical protein